MALRHVGGTVDNVVAGSHNYQKTLLSSVYPIYQVRSLCFIIGIKFLASTRIAKDVRRSDSGEFEVCW